MRAWQGMLIQSLDPVPQWAWAAHAPETRRIRSTSPPAGDRVLSNERTITRWAYTAELSPIFVRPRAGSRRVSRLRRYTEDGFPEIYLLLRLHRDAAGREWVKLRIPMHPSGSVGWVPREALGDLHMTRDLLVVDRRRLHMEFFTNGRSRWSAPVGVGKPNTPTPPGQFWIRERFKIFDPGSGYWPYAFGTTDDSKLSDWPGCGLLGIHGPRFEPSAIPGSPSQGSIGLRVADDAWLAKHLGLGTPLVVL